MVTVMVVDDEYLAREGMKRTVDWKAAGCQLIGEAENAFEAMELTDRLKPDIIITDISMPGMNGLDMAKEIRARHVNCRFIIVTGYDQFEYAKAAVKINAVDFLLKPIDQSELLEAIQKAAQDIEKLKAEGAAVSEKVLLEAMRVKFTDRNNMLQVLRLNKIYFKDVVIALMENDNYEKLVAAGREIEIHDQKISIREVISKRFDNRCFVVECHRDRIAAVLDVSAITNQEAFMEDLRLTQKEIADTCNTTVTIGISSRNPLENLNVAYSQSKNALANKMYSGKASINYYRETSSSNTTLSKAIAEVKEGIKLALKARDRHKVEELIRKLYFDIFKNNKAEEHVIRQTSIELVLLSTDTLKEFGIPVERVFGKNFNFYKHEAAMSTVKELYEMVTTYLLKILQVIREQKNEEEESGVEKAVEYIKEHFCEDLSLGEVAAKCYLSESYLSRRMKQVTGIGFTEYITKLRMEKAILCLKSPGIKITEVAARVGYPDYRYFSQIFKRYTGYVPSDFIKGVKD